MLYSRLKFETHFNHLATMGRWSRRTPRTSSPEYQTRKSTVFTQESLNLWFHMLRRFRYVTFLRIDRLLRHLQTHEINAGLMYHTWRHSHNSCGHAPFHLAADVDCEIFYQTRNLERDGVLIPIQLRPQALLSAYQRMRWSTLNIIVISLRSSTAREETQWRLPHSHIQDNPCIHWKRIFLWLPEPNRNEK